MCCVTPGSFRLVKSPLSSLNVSLPPLWFASNNLIGGLKNSAFWTSKGVGDVYLLLLDWALADLKRKVEYSGSSRVPTPLGLAKKDKALSL